MRLLFLSFFIIFSFLNSTPVLAEEHFSDGQKINVNFFGREDCRFCLAEKDFLNNLKKERDDFRVIYYDIKNDKEAKIIFNRLAEAKEVSKTTPLTVIGNNLIQGFNSPETTGSLIEESITGAQKNSPITIEDFINNDTSHVLGSSTSSCDGEGLESCEVGQSFSFNLPLIGVVDLETFSLFSLATILGFVDGFNPCAMWVLITFLLILLQIGDKRKMWQIAGLFIFAEAIMYFFILNIWYKTWDFIGLDYIVTPIIALVAIGGGVYFLYKYFQNKNTCDVTSLEYQSGVEKKIKKLVEAPATILTFLGIIGIAFSVNIIEFACSIGIPQAFTKILEINSLSFLAHQFYILVYTFFYMIDDLIVFGLALWGFNKIHLSYKYSRWSSLIGGVLMIILGFLLFFAPNLLVF